MIQTLGSSVFQLSIHTQKPNDVTTVLNILAMNNDSRLVGSLSTHHS